MADHQPGLVAQARNLVFDIANRRHVLSKLVPVGLFFLDAVLCALIIWKVPYTEIDWRAYMEQVAQYVSGERDYTVIKGGTGPLVYPAAHVYTYHALYNLTNEGKDIVLAQELFAGLYMVTLALVMMCYWKAKYLTLTGSSVRFSTVDCVQAIAQHIRPTLFQRLLCGLLLLGHDLLFPTQGMDSRLSGFHVGSGDQNDSTADSACCRRYPTQGRGFGGALRSAAIIAQVQFVIGIPFLRENAHGYLSRAFELSRQFFFKWTVNWRFVGEDVFLSRPFSLLLLGSHVTVLVTFAIQKWLKPSRKSLAAIVAPILQFHSPFSAQEEPMVASGVTSTYIMTTILTANIIGLLFARSLHYQFYSYIAWATPYLLWRSGAHPIFQYVLWAVQEWAWNVFPSTPVSSGVVIAAMVITTASSWFAANKDFDSVPRIFPKPNKS
ncbi:alpha-1-3-mannosyltransferase [Apiospora sp. TS-2023a]